jgi:hydroxymethylbilane synthase
MATGVPEIRIGSRGSQLALWQAEHVAALLRAAGHSVSIEIIRTTGDRMQPGADEVFAREAAAQQAQGAPALDGKGIFIKEIEEALAEGRIDLAVHSLKDLPTALDERFTLAAIPARADARDVWVCEPYWGLHMLPMGGRIGTTSPRRKAQLLALRPDVECVELRGNIDTRLRKLEAGECDALVLAGAGLDRLGRTEWVHQRFAVDELTPAAGQGALALETRAAQYAVFAEPERDDAVRGAVAALDDAATRFAVTVERAALDSLGGGCQLPVGVYCGPVTDGISSELAGWHIHAQVVAPDGERVMAAIERAPAGAEAKRLGATIAERLCEMGARELLEEYR